MTRETLTEDEYRRLCDACDAVLLAPDSTIERTAIPWLHVVREHPVFLSKYVHLFRRDGGVHFIRRLQARLKDEARWYLQTARAWRGKHQPWFESSDLPRKADVLLVSHLLNPAHAGREHDFYFADVGNALRDNGRSVVIVLMNHTGSASARLASAWAKAGIPRIVPAEALSVGEEVALRSRLNTESRRLKQLATKEPDGLKKRVLRWASREALSTDSARTLRWASQLSAIVRRLHADAIVVTHEGHAYERISFAAARRVSPAIRCIGYQHAALFRLQHAIKRTLAAPYNPDWILTAGSVSKQQLEEAPGLQRISIAVLGSNRVLDTNAVQSARADRGTTAGSPLSSCLVIPEGHKSEYSLLFGFALECAKRNAGVRFVFRTHPILSFESVASRIPRLRALPENVEISRFTLEQDMARCHWALYRGTTAIVQATLAGLRPVYLSVPGEMTIDPLYELDGWRLVVRTSEEFLALVHRPRSSDTHEDTGVRQRAYDYCRRFFVPLDAAVLLEAAA